MKKEKKEKKKEKKAAKAAEAAGDDFDWDEYWKKEREKEE